MASPIDIAQRERRIAEAEASADPTYPGRVASTLEELRRAADAGSHPVTADGRVGENDLAAMLGWKPSSLANMRRRGEGPPHYAIAAHGHRVTYRLQQVAAWLELQYRRAA